MTLKDTALAIAAVSLLAEKAALRKEELREQLANLLEELGATATKAELPDGTLVAKVSLAGGKKRAQISDEALLTAWVEREHPSEVVPAIRDSFRKHLMDNIEETASGHAVFKATGEIVPGIQFREGSSYVSTRWQPEGKDAVLEAIKNQALAIDLTDTPALEQA
jgi:hypothetical protein